MWTLNMLGGLALDPPAGSSAGRAGQRRRLALLAVLARAPTGRVSRDRLVGLLWPECTEVEARHSLSSALYDLRSALGERAILGRGEDVELAAPGLRTDVAELESAIAIGDAEAALSIYRGPFLNGIHLSGTRAFDEWAEEERQRLRSSLYDAVTGEADRRLASGDATSAAVILHRLVALEPHRTDLVLRLAKAFEASGDRAPALDAISTHTQRLRQDLDIEPDVSLLEMEQRLRAPPLETREVVASGAIQSHTAAELTSPTLEAARVSVQDTLDATSTSRMRGVRGVLVASAAVVALFSVGVLLAPGVLAPTSSAISPNDAGERDPTVLRLAVLPFEVQGETGLQHVGRGVFELLSRGLNRIGPLSTVDPEEVLAWSAGPSVDGGASPDAAALAPDEADGAATAARTLNADLLVTGTIWTSGERLRILASLRKPDGVRRMEVSAEGAASDLLTLVDSVGTQLAGEALAADYPEARTGSLNTASLAALGAWIEGETLFQNGQFLPAIDAFDAAVREDSTFARAHYRRALATLWADAPGARSREAEQAAMRHAARLPARERRLVEAFAAWRRGDADRAENLYRRIVAEDLGDLEAWSQLGETLLHYNPLRGRPAEEARDAFQHVLAERPDDWGALWHIAQLDALAGRRDLFYAHVDRLLELDPDGDRTLEIRLLGSLAPGNPNRGERPDELNGVERERLVTAAWRAAVHIGDTEAASRFLQPLTRSRSRNDATVGLALAGWLDLAAGRPEAARQAARKARASADLAWYAFVGLEVEAYSYLPPFAPAEPREAARLVRSLDSLAAQPDLRPFGSSRFPVLVAGLLEAASGAYGRDSVVSGSEDAVSKSERLRVRLRKIDEHAALDDADPDPAREALQGWIAWLEGDMERAVAHFQRSREHLWFGDLMITATQGGALFRYLLGEALFASGRGSEALAWYRSLEENTLPDLAWRAPGLLSRARILEALGRTGEADTALRAAREAWSNAEPWAKDHLRAALEERQ